MKAYLKPLIKISIVLIYLIIIAGAIVRMTGSGMGCPDWPKCFGYYIPPTNESQILWQPNTFYNKGTIVIYNDALKVANKNFNTDLEFNYKHWEAYTKHDYAKFNVWHTWIEYINRLVTVVSGLPILLVFISSFWYRKINKQIPIVATFVILAMLFQAWLGKVVVDSNLLPFRITVHMMVAFLILGLLLYLLFLVNPIKSILKYSKRFKIILGSALLITVIQVVLGTQVRQYVDEQIKIFGDIMKNKWLDPPSLIFYIHRSLSILVVLINGWIFLKLKELGNDLKKIYMVLILISLEAFTGILMYYFDFPWASQPAHILLASLLFGVQLYICFEIFILRKVTN